MKSWLTLFILLLSTIDGYTQQENPFMNDANGKPLYWGSTYVAEGSPYLHKDYNWADITVLSGKVYKDVRVKYNMVEHQLQYLLDDGTEMISTTPVKTISFTALPGDQAVPTKALFESETGVINSPDAVIYQVLDSGNISLLKRIIITYRDDKRYGEAVTTRHFTRQELNYVKDQKGQYKKLEKSRSFITELCKEKMKEINAYIDANKLSCKNISDIQQIIHYYNSLFH